MIVNVEKAKDESVVVSSQESIAEAKFGVQVDEKLYSILSSRIYSDKVLAPIRELSCNAYDAHVAAGKPEEPISVQLPTREDPTFAVQDFGTGMSVDTIMNLYTQYGNSDKLNSNDIIGCWGLGSKSPFAYTKTFTVVSVYEGVRNVFVAAIEDGYPTIRHELSEPTDDPSGTLVSFPVREGDIDSFRKAAHKFYKTFRPYPIIDGMVADVPPLAVEHGVLIPESGYDYAADDCVLMGNVPYYFIRQKLLECTPDEDRDVFKHLDNYVTTTYVLPIGAVDVAVSRETIEYTPTTVRAIIKAMNHYVAAVQAEYESIKKEYAERPEFERKQELWKCRNKYRPVRFSSDEANESVSVDFHKLFGLCKMPVAEWRLGGGGRERYKIRDNWYSFALYAERYASGARCVVLYNDNSSSVRKTTIIDRYAHEHRGSTRLDIFVISSGVVAEELRKRGVPVVTLSEYRASIAKTTTKKPRKSAGKNPDGLAAGWSIIDIHSDYYCNVSRTMTNREVEELRNLDKVKYYLVRSNNKTVFDDFAVQRLFSEHYAGAGAALIRSRLGMEDARMSMMRVFESAHPSDCGFTLMRELLKESGAYVRPNTFPILLLSESVAANLSGDDKFVNILDKMAKLCSGVEGNLVDNISKGLWHFANTPLLRKNYSVDSSWGKHASFVNFDFDSFVKAKKAYDKLSAVDAAVLHMVDLVTQRSFTDVMQLGELIKAVVAHRWQWNDAMNQLFPLLDRSSLFPANADMTKKELEQQYVEAMTLWHKKNTFKKVEAKNE